MSLHVSFVLIYASERTEAICTLCDTHSPATVTKPATSKRSCWDLNRFWLAMPIQDSRLHAVPNATSLPQVPLSTGRLLTQRR